MPPETSKAKRRRSTRKPIQKATVIMTASEQQIRSTSPTDKKILDRIQKCLNRAYHANTSEVEAKVALFVSQKLMSQHNVRQADLIADDGSDSNSHHGGQSVVRITKIAGCGRVTQETFADKLASAMCTLFSCKCFSADHHTYVLWTFFGIAENTAAAAMAFEMAHNKILEWACAYKGGTPTFSYRLGVADGLAAMANREKQRELYEVRCKEIDLITAQEREEAGQREREVETLQLLSGHATVDSSPLDSSDQYLDSMYTGSNIVDSDSDLDESNGFTTKADFDAKDAQTIVISDDVDEDIERLVKREPMEPTICNRILKSNEQSDIKIKAEPEHQSGSTLSLWGSEKQLVQFRATAEQVADDYLTQNKIRLHNGRKISSVVRDKDAYRQGQQDSSKIEVRQQVPA